MDGGVALEACSNGPLFRSTNATFQKSEIWQLHTPERMHLSARLCSWTVMHLSRNTCRWEALPALSKQDFEGWSRHFCFRRLGSGFVSNNKQTNNGKGVSVIAWGREEAYLPQHQTVLLFPLETSPLP